ncbi:MAG: tRNA pseudouridine(38-40) synthase TruA [SAR202 cluster bacterium]|jgi:tRNA pseudouridine38-40 synthase|nr:tRNA pseudouridine(38-40) synthase TruA [SAR202 cluster bacterium]
MRLALIIEYDGTAYRGFQFQQNGPSIQEQLEKSITALTGEKVRIKAAGRTDAGVHALGQVVAFDTAATHAPDTVLRAVNHRLPDDIAVRAAYRVDDRFDPRRHALSRIYRYTILTGTAPAPLRRRTSTLIRDDLDVALMDEGAKMLIGVHDFARFGGPLEPEGASTVREVFSSGMAAIDDTIVFNVEGNAFLPHQVRRMIGALVDVGRGAMAIENLGQMIDGKETGATSRSLPPQGLCLIKVTYAEFPPKVGE